MYSGGLTGWVNEQFRNGRSKESRQRIQVPDWYSALPGEHHTRLLLRKLQRSCEHHGTDSGGLELQEQDIRRGHA